MIQHDPQKSVRQRNLREQRKLDHICVQCGNHSSFPYQTRCIFCIERESNRRSRGEDKDRRREYKRHVRWRVFEKYGGIKCFCCGITEFLFLTLDHQNNDGKKDRTQYPNSDMFYQMLLKTPVRKDLRVSCLNCNLGRHFNGGVCPCVKPYVHHPLKDRRK